MNQKKCVKLKGVIAKHAVMEGAETKRRRPNGR